MKNLYVLSFCVLAICPVPFLKAQSDRYSIDKARPIPTTRPALKQFIEDVKLRTPRIPLPAVSDFDREMLSARWGDYESRIKLHYLGQQPAQSSAARRGSQQDSNMTLDYGFKVELFWIVSRANNCQYCLGHQETKLLAAGREEDTIAALDCDWSRFTDSERAAFEFAQTYTNTPYQLSPDDITALRAFYTDLQILEMCLSMSWNNAINRWKEAIGVPQRADEGGYSRLAMDDSTAELELSMHGSYLTPTSPKFQQEVSQVAPLASAKRDRSSFIPFDARPALESRQYVHSRLEETRTRVPQLPLLAVAETETILGELQHVPINVRRLLAHFPDEGRRRAKALNDALGDEQLSSLTKGQIQWIVARHDRCWYLAAHAFNELTRIGWSEDQIFRLDDDWNDASSRDRSLFVLARNLASSPVVLTDQQVTEAVELAGPEQVVRVVQLVSQLSGLTRLTRAAQLQTEF